MSPAGLRSGPCAVVPSARASVALPAHVPVLPSRHHRPPADHLSVRRRGASAVPGPLFPSAAGPRATAGAQPRVGPSAAQPHRVRQSTHRSAGVLRGHRPLLSPHSAGAHQPHRQQKHTQQRPSQSTARLTLSGLWGLVY